MRLGKTDSIHNRRQIIFDRLKINYGWGDGWKTPREVGNACSPDLNAMIKMGVVERAKLGLTEKWYYRIPPSVYLENWK